MASRSVLLLLQILVVAVVLASWTAGVPKASAEGELESFSEAPSRLSPFARRRLISDTRFPCRLVDNCKDKKKNPFGGSTCCFPFCKDLTSDKFNCGRCGVICKLSGQQCCNGKCVKILEDKNNCGKCGTKCKGKDQCSRGLCGYNGRGGHGVGDDGHGHGHY